MVNYNIFPNMKIRCAEIDSEETLELLRKENGLDSGTWYATKEEIEMYKIAQERLEISEDAMWFYNPTDIDVWITRKGHESFCVPAGRKIDFKNIEQ